MSDSEDSTTDAKSRRAFGELEERVNRLLEAHASVRRRAARAEARVVDLESLLRSFGKGDADPAELQLTLERIRDRNHNLRGRISKGREGVERLLARLRFLEEQG